MLRNTDAQAPAASSDTAETYTAAQLRQIVSRALRDEDAGQRLALEHSLANVLAHEFESGSLLRVHPNPSRALTARQAHHALVLAAIDTSPCTAKHGPSHDRAACTPCSDHEANVTRLFKLIKAELDDPTASQDEDSATPPGAIRQHCASCGKAYIAYRARSRYCSSACRQQGHRQRQAAGL